MTNLRRAVAADIPGVLALWSAAGAEPTHTDDAPSLQTLMKLDPEAMVVAEFDGDGGADLSIVGSVIAGWDGWRGSIYRLVVHPGHRRQGLGGRLVREAEVTLARRGAVRLSAVVVESDALATSFWRASGWEEQVERLRFVRG
jgi:ribosomal protein S18 acetylase RimI-like enzyme